MLGVALGDIAVPVLLVHNHDDGCRESPFGDTASAMARMQHAPDKELIAGVGRFAAQCPCDALSPHGYYGIEDSGAAIIAWIKAH